MVTGLKKYFPMIRSRKEVLEEIQNDKKLSDVFDEWNEEQQEEFLNFCTGVRGAKILYDSFFKEILNPETVPERLEELLSLILQQNVRILKVLPNDSTRIADGYLHRFSQQSDTGIKVELLQEFVFIALDNFKETQHNMGIRNKLEAWLTFLSMEAPEDIIRLVEKYPEYRKMYEEVYTLCLNTEKVMGMFSKELLELDRNTVQYMIDEMQDEIDAQKASLIQKDQDLLEKEQENEKQRQENEKQRQEIAALKKKLEELQKY